MNNTINIKSMPVEIESVNEESSIVDLKIGNKSATIHEQQPWLLDLEVVALGCWNDYVVAIGKDGNEYDYCTDDPRILKIAKVLSGRNVDGLQKSDLVPGRIFPPIE